MGRFTALLLNGFRRWDAAARIAMLIAVALLIVAIGVAAFGGQAVRVPALIGIFGLLVVMQATFMWANRGMVTAYTQAQRAYLAEEFETARDLLETLRQSGKADVRELTLLGNTYRQLGLLAQSKTILLEALDKHPEHHFPLYGFGRTLLSEGHYEDAAQTLRRALDAGAPLVVQLDLGEAYYHLQQWEDAIVTLQSAAALDQEPYRKLMTVYLLYRLGAGDRPSRTLIESGLSYWQANAERFHLTPYGQALAGDVDALRHMMQEE